MPRGKQQYIAVYIFVPERGQLIMKCVLIGNYKYRQMVACGWSAADIMEGVALHHSRVMPCPKFVPGAICELYPNNRCSTIRSCLITVTA